MHRRLGVCTVVDPLCPRAMSLVSLLLLSLQEAALPPPSAGGIEESVVNAVQWLRLLVETMGAVVIGIGMVLAIGRFGQALWAREPERFNAIRLLLARYLALALEFQLAADILSTAIAPSWNQIGKLGAIAVIRTALNFFLSREMEQERTQVAPRHPDEDVADHADG